MITGINESKTLTKHISCEWNVNLIEENVIQINDEITINVSVSAKNVKYVKKIVWNAATFSCENGKYLASIMDDSAIICDEIIAADIKAKAQSNKDAKTKLNDETKAIPTNFNEKNGTSKTQNLSILLDFLLISIALLIAVSIFCYLIKNKTQQKHLLPFQFLNNKLKEITY